MKFRDVGMKTKFIFGTAFPLLIIVFLATSGVWTIHYVTRTICSLDHITKINRDAAYLETALSTMESELLSYLLSGEEKQLKSYETASKMPSFALAGLREKVRDNPREVQALTHAEQFLSNWQKHVAEKVIERRKRLTDWKDISQSHLSVSTGEVRENFERIKDTVASLRKTVDRIGAEQVKESSYFLWLMEKLIIYGVGMVIVISVVLGYWFGWKVAKPLESAATLLKAIAKGDLSRRLNVTGKDEIGRLAASLDAMVDAMRGQVEHMSEAVKVLSTSASEISSTVSQLAQSTSRTSVAVTEANTTVEEVKQAAAVAREKARNVAEVANSAVQTSISGKTATDNTSQRMTIIKDQMASIGDTVGRLSEHSQAIEAIMATVKDLADQSNLLAVNASIEASRAGEHGKGFVVVAQEIKALADQSSQATDQVRAILKDTSKWVSAVVMATEQGNRAVEAGVQQSAIAGNSIQELADSVAASAQSASVIETTSEQQTIGVEQVSEAMQHIVMAIQQNEAGTAQIERAANQMADVGLRLQTIVDRFRL